MRWNILTNSGYRYEYAGAVVADTVKQARAEAAWFLGGETDTTGRKRDFKVQRQEPIDAENIRTMGGGPFARGSHGL